MSNLSLFLYVIVPLIAATAAYSLGKWRSALYVFALAVSSLVAWPAMAILYIGSKNPLGWPLSVWHGLHLGVFMLSLIFVVEKLILRNELRPSIVVFVSAFGTATLYFVVHVLMSA